MEQVTRMVSGNPVAIFSKSGTCPVSHSVTYLLHDYGVKTAVYELDKIPRGREIEQALSTLGRNPPVVPAVFIGDELVGGSANDLYSLHLKGELRPMLIRVGAIWL